LSALSFDETRAASCRTEDGGDVSEGTTDPVPSQVVLQLDEVFRVLEAREDARLELRDRGLLPGLQDELATVVRMLHGTLGLDEGGVP
jgi:hypothetical protein